MWLQKDVGRKWTVGWTGGREETVGAKEDVGRKWTVGWTGGRGEAVGAKEGVGRKWTVVWTGGRGEAVGAKEDVGRKWTVVWTGGRGEAVGAKEDATDQATVSTFCLLQHWESRRKVLFAVKFPCWLCLSITYRNLMSNWNLSEYMFWFSKGIIYCICQEAGPIYCLSVGLAQICCVCQWVWSDV
jgi:hypothetical protein